MEGIVYFSHSFITVSHQHGTVIVVGLPSSCEHSQFIWRDRKWESLKAVLWNVSGVVLKRRSKELCPDLVGSTLHDAKRRGILQKKYRQGVRKNGSSFLERNCMMS